MGEHVRRLQVDKGVKVFNVGDEFLMHVFKAHLTASICSSFKINSVTDAIPHENTYEWLRSAAERLVADTHANIIKRSCFQNAQDIPPHILFVCRLEGCNPT